MFKYILKRIIIGAITLFILSSVTFFLMKAIPGSPISGENTKQLKRMKLQEKNIIWINLLQSSI